MSSDHEGKRTPLISEVEVRCIVDLDLGYECLCTGRQSK
jgi:hypothetical protein